MEETRCRGRPEKRKTQYIITEMYNKDTIRTEEKEMIETRCRGRPQKRKSQQFIKQMYNVDTIIQEVRDCERNEMPRTAL